MDKVIVAVAVVSLFVVNTYNEMASHLANKHAHLLLKDITREGDTIVSMVRTKATPFIGCDKIGTSYVSDVYLKYPDAGVLYVSRVKICANRKEPLKVISIENGPKKLL